MIDRSQTDAIDATIAYKNLLVRADESEQTKRKSVRKKFSFNKFQMIIYLDSNS